MMNWDLDFEFWILDLFLNGTYHFTVVISLTLFTLYWVRGGLGA